MGEDLKPSHIAFADSNFEMREELVGRSLSLEGIMAAVSKISGVSQDDIKSSKRKRYITEARFAAMFIIYRLFPRLALVDIGTEFGNRDHSTVIHSLERAEFLVENDLEFKRMFDEICGELDPEGNLRKRF